MHAKIGPKVASLLENHDELRALMSDDPFNQFDAETQLRLMTLYEEVDAAMNAINQQLDVLNCEIAELIGSLKPQPPEAD